MATYHSTANGITVTSYEIHVKIFNSATYSSGRPNFRHPTVRVLIEKSLLFIFCSSTFNYWYLWVFCFLYEIYISL